MAVQATIIAVCFLAYLMAMTNPSRLFTASTLFAYTQVLMVPGTFILLDPANEADRVHGWVLTTALVTYLVANFLFTLGRKKAESRSAEMEVFLPSRGTWVLVAVSALVVVAYYRAVGSSAFLLGLQSMFSGVDADIATARLDAYASSRYLFPGYVNQFKNALLPGLTVLFATARWGESRTKRWVLVPLAVLSVFGLLGTGQRAPFVLFALVSLLYLYYYSGMRVSRRLVRLLLVAVFVVLLATAALGRSASRWDPNGSTLQKLGVAASEIAKRVVLDEQESSVAGFRYIYYQPIQYGAEWLQSALGVLPGHRGSDLSNRIYATLFGSPRGTAPPSVWGSTYHNFGWPGVLVLPVLLALIFANLSHRGTKPASRSTLETLGIAGVFMVIGFWTTGSPDALLNDGIVVYGLMWWWGGRSLRRAQLRQRYAVREAL